MRVYSKVDGMSKRITFTPTDRQQSFIETYQTMRKLEKPQDVLSVALELLEKQAAVELYERLVVLEQKHGNGTTSRDHEQQGRRKQEQIEVATRASEPAEWEPSEDPQEVPE